MFKISPHTKISELVKANPQCIAEIASLSKPLERLKNPLLRKILAPRVTIADATKIGKCDLSDFRRVLEPLGFIWIDEEEKPRSQTDQKPTPVWLRDKLPTFTIDVRDDIDNGDDPLLLITRHYQALQTGEILCIVNSFIPTPLISRLEKKGAASFVKMINEQQYHTFFLKPHIAPQEGENRQPLSFLEQADFLAALGKDDQLEVVHLDVRSLPMPQPMESILLALDTLQQTQKLYIRHKRIPLHLLEELEDTQLKIRISEFDHDDVRLLISK